MALLPAALRCTRLTIPVLCSVRLSLPVSSLHMSSRPQPCVSLSPTHIRNSTELSRYYATGSHSDSRHWSMERYVSVTLITLLPAAVMFPSSAVVNYGLAFVVPLHGHWGLQQVVIDYVHGPTLNRICNALIYAVTMGTCLGLLYLNYYDVGVTKAVAKLWSL